MGSGYTGQGSPSHPPHPSHPPQGRGLVESFLVKLTLLLKGTATAAPEKFGETLTDEQQRGGESSDGGVLLTMSLSEYSISTFHGLQKRPHALSHHPLPVTPPLCLLTSGAFLGESGRPLPVPEGLPNSGMRLLGGAQFHRAMAEFRLAVGGIQVD
jgi:hypothetical protein